MDRTGMDRTGGDPLFGDPIRWGYGSRGEHIVTRLVLALAAAGLLAACSAEEAPTEGGRAEVRIVGSSTVFPFTTRVAEEYKNKSGNNVVVESTGSGGGHKRFCEGLGVETPDITGSSRRQKVSEFEDCQASGVTGVIEVKIGYDGIVLANARTAAVFDLTEKQIFQAFAAKLPRSDEDCTLIDNPYTNWSQIDPALPDQTIEAYGPPPTSGTRDAFVELAMEAGAKGFGCLSRLSRARPDRDDYAERIEAVTGLEPAWLTDANGDPRDGEDIFTEVAHKVREDGRWIDSGENDNAIVATLERTPTAVGVFGYSFKAQNEDKIKAGAVNGVMPDVDTIASGDYPISRSLYVYVKEAHAAGDVAGIPAQAIQGFLQELTSEGAWGPGGYLEQLGLIPLTEEERADFAEAAQTLRTYQP